MDRADQEIGGFRAEGGATGHGLRYDRRMGVMETSQIHPSSERVGIRSGSGYALLELLLATLIIGLLAASLMTSLQTATASSDEALGDSPVLKQAVERWLQGPRALQDLEALQEPGALEGEALKRWALDVEAPAPSGDESEENGKPGPFASESERRAFVETVGALEGEGLLDEWVERLRGEMARRAEQGSADPKGESKLEIRMDGEEPASVRSGDPEMVWSDGAPVRLADRPSGQ